MVEYQYNVKICKKYLPLILIFFSISRGTFANIRLVNKLNNGGKTGPKTLHHPTNEIVDIFDAAARYKEVSLDCLFICMIWGSGN